MLCMVSCVEPLNHAEIQELWPVLDIWIELPDGMEEAYGEDQGVETKANITPKGKESYLNEMQIWAFDHADANANNSNALPIGYVEMDNINKTAGSNWNTVEKAFKMQIRISTAFLESYETPRADFYVLANWKSIYDQANRPGMALTLGQVRALTFGSGDRPAGEAGPGAPGTDKFGPADGTCWLWSKTFSQGATPVLPMSAIHRGSGNNGVDLTFLKNVYANFEEPTSNEINTVGVVQLQRAVTKLRFVFSKPVDLANVTIRQIVLDGGVIPERTNVFQLQSGKVSLSSDVEYHEEARLFATGQFEHQFPLLPNRFTAVLGQYANWVPIDIGESIDPENLKSSMSSESEYETKLQTAVEQGTVIEMVTYLRETNRRISGKIYYSVGEESHENESEYPYAVFTMPETTKHFCRNNVWSVYAFFLNDEMHFRVDNTYWSDEGAHKPGHSFN